MFANWRDKMLAAAALHANLMHLIVRGAYIEALASVAAPVSFAQTV